MPKLLLPVKAGRILVETRLVSLYNSDAYTDWFSSVISTGSSRTIVSPGQIKKIVEKKAGKQGSYQLHTVILPGGQSFSSELSLVALQLRSGDGQITEIEPEVLGSGGYSGVLASDLIDPVIGMDVILRSKFFRFSGSGQPHFELEFD